VIQTQHATTNKEADLITLCKQNHISYSFIPNTLEIQRTNLETEHVENMPLIRLKPTPLDGWGKVYKRIFDIVFSILLIILTSPILLLSAIAIKLDSKGTIIFKYLDDGSIAQRVGKKGRHFHAWKFRTMHPGTHLQRYKELAKQDTRKGPLVKIKNDPRVTRVGRFLRKTSIDELPGFVNVLLGNMSVVGPRPHLPEEVAKYKPHQRFVLEVKPGVTGLAQVAGRSDLDFAEENRLDTYYIENWTPWLDIKIIIKTIFVVLKGYKAD